MWGVDPQPGFLTTQDPKTATLDLELEGLAGLAAVATEDKALQFGRSFQRHASEPQPGPRAPTYSVFRTVHTQGQWAYREGYPLPYEPPATDGSPGPAPAPPRGTPPSPTLG